MLNQQTFSQISQFITPLMTDPQQRRTLVESALYGTVVLNQINWTGDPTTFARNLVRRLDTYGRLDDGRLALAALLEGMRGQVGTDRQQEIDGFLAAITDAETKANQQTGYATATEDGAFVFLSYAREDIDLVERIRESLRGQGVNVWIDHVGLKPGTPDWEEALRRAIKRADGLMLVATPNSRKSLFVRDEIAIAQMYARPIYPLWAKGDDWHDCIPMGMGSMQYVDVRGVAYTDGIKRIVTTLNGDIPTPTPPEKTVTDPRNPYKGLRAFREQDKGDFFGRETLIDELVTATQHASDASRFLAVIGASGSGKSSVVMAGLLPTLKAQQPDWVYLNPIVPGKTPLDNLTVSMAKAMPAKSMLGMRDDLQHPSMRGLDLLARQMVDDGQRAVLYVDQFEEIFTLTTHEDERVQFINLLTTAATSPDGALLVLLTMRADFYEYLLSYGELGALVTANTTPVLPMTLADLHNAIERPASLPGVGVTFEPGLVGEIVYTLRGQQGALVGALPLLQFTLEQLFEARQGNQLKWDAYYTIGGVQGAIGSQAEAVFNQLGEDAQAALPSVFMKLVSVDERGTATRQRANLSAFEAGSAARQLVDALTDGRLLITGKDEHGQAYVEVVHEALLNRWTRLADWIESVTDDRMLWEKVRLAALDWKEGRGPQWGHEHLQPVYDMIDRLQLQQELDETTNAFIEPEWIRLLEEFKSPSTQDYRRQMIVDVWQRIGSVAVPAMIKALHHVRSEAVLKKMYPYLLYTEQDISDQITVISTMLDYSDFQTNLDALDAAQDIAHNRNDTRIVAPLVKALGKANDSIRTIAAGLLINSSQALQEAALEEVEQTYMAQRIAYLKVVGHVSGKSPEEFLMQYQNASIETQARVIYLLATLDADLHRLKIDVFQFLKDALQSDSLSLQSSAIWTINLLAMKKVRHFSTEQFFILATVLEKNLQYPWLQGYIAEALGNITNPRTIASLIEAFEKQSHADTRRRIVDALGKFDNPIVIPTLQKALADQVGNVRSSAARALAKIGNEKVVPDLIKTLDDERISVRKHAIEALGRIGDPQALPMLLQKLKEPTLSKFAADAVRGLKIGEENENQLLDVIANMDEDWQIRVVAIEKLVHFTRLQTEENVDRVVSYINKLLEDEEQDIHGPLTMALGKIGSANAIPTLTQLTKHKDVQVRQAAILSLGQIGDIIARDALEQAMYENEGNLQFAAIKALRDIGGKEALQTLRSFLDDSRLPETVKRAAHRAIDSLRLQLLKDAIKERFGPEVLDAMQVEYFSLPQLEELAATYDIVFDF